MKLSYDATWQDIAGLLRTHADILLVVTGVFLFLPALAQAFYFPPPPTSGLNEATMRAFLAYYEENFPAIFAARLVSLSGTGAILALLLGPDRPTVGHAISQALRLLPTLFLVEVLGQLMVIGGGLLLILPGLYLMARIALSAAATMAERISNPLRALGRSFAMTKGAGWSVFGLLAIVMIVLWIASSALITVFGVIGALLLPAEGAKVLQMAFAALSTAVLMLGSTLLSAGLYRQLRQG